MWVFAVLPQKIILLIQLRLIWVGIRIGHYNSCSLTFEYQVGILKSIYCGCSVLNQYFDKFVSNEFFSFVKVLWFHCSNRFRKFGCNVGLSGSLGPQHQHPDCIDVSIGDLLLSQFHFFQFIRKLNILI